MTPPGAWVPLDPTKQAAYEAMELLDSGDIVLFSTKALAPWNCFCWLTLR